MSISLPCGEGGLPTKAEYVQLFNDIGKLPTDLRTQIAAQAESLEDDVRAEIEQQIKDIEEVMEGVGDLLAPWWEKGQIRNWEKEAEDAITELIQEFHIFVPVKMMELISKIIPVEFTVPVLGLSIDVLKIADGDYQTELKGQITDEMYALVPEQYRLFDGEFGVKCDEWKAKLTWSYIKNEIMEWCTMSLFKLFEKLIDKFKEIWDALGLPDLPVPLSFDMAEWIRTIIDQKKAELDTQIEEWETQLENLDSDIQNFDLTASIGELKDNIIADIKEIGVPLPAPFDITIGDIFGGDIEKTVLCMEDEIHQICTAARDWKIITMKELFNIWLKKIKKFLDAIGLGKLLEFLDWTFCDVLGMIGKPTSFDVVLPEIEIPTPELELPV